MSFSDYSEDGIINAIFNNVAFPAQPDRFLKLYIGDPGENGTANAAAETTRKSITGAAASGGVFTSVNDLVWTNVAATETYSHVAVWDDATGGNCLWVGALTASKAVVAGDTFTIPTGSLTATAS